MKRLTTDEQLQKLNRLDKLAKTASESEDLDRHFGAYVIHAGMVEFLLIQFARILEQVVLKGQMNEGGTPKFAPKPDEWFYGEKVRSRRILSEAKKLLPFSGHPQAEQGSALAKKFISKANKFLGYRDTIIHHIGSPLKSYNDVVGLLEKSKKAYNDFMTTQKEFCEFVHPFRFSEKEMAYFYGADQKKV